MPPFELILAGFALVAVNVYLLSGGADFGGGWWDFFASGPRAKEQRELVGTAIAPIWEANHVWLIVVIVVLFSAFPAAFATLSIALHIPLLLMLVGIVLRGSAFAFRAYDDRSERARQGWSRVFGVGSILAPFMLGVCIGTVASGEIRVDPPQLDFASRFVGPWLAFFPLVTGAFTVAICAFLAAVYLTLETDDPELQADFRRKALRAAIAVGVLAWASVFLAIDGAPLVRQGLLHRPWSIPLQVATGAAALVVFWALWRRRFAVARAAAIAQVTLIVWGWALSQEPYLVPPDLTIDNAAAPIETLRAVTIALACGLVLLLPAFWYLYRVFKGHSAKRG